MLQKYILYIVFCWAILLSACNSEQENQTYPDVSTLEVKVDIQRIDRELLICKDKNELLNYFKKNERFIIKYFQTTPEDFEKLADNLLPIITNQAFKDFYQQSQEPKFFGSNQLENDFKEAFQHLKYYYPDFKEPKICTIFTGFYGQNTLSNPELIVSDSLIIIGLDYFMGKQGKFLPDIYDYQLRKASPAAIVPQVVLLLSAKYNATKPSEKSLLADMVWYGKSYVFGHTMMPSKADSLFIGYSDAQLTDSYTFQKDIWAHFIDHKLLYATEEPIKAKYVGERPSTPEISASCPGSIGRWLGWRIVGKYFDENEKLTIQELMKQNDAQKIFEQSKYKGLPDEE
jgi:hypothetical protein